MMDIQQSSQAAQAFVAGLDRTWKLAVISPMDEEFPEVWERIDVICGFINRLLVLAGLLVLAYYDSRKKGPAARSYPLDELINRLLRDGSRRTVMDAAVGLSALQWSMECDAVPLVQRGALTSQHIMRLHVFTRGRQEAHHLDYQRFAMEAAKVPFNDLVDRLLGAVRFMQGLTPVPGRRGQARLTTPTTSDSTRLETFRLDPFFWDTPYEGEDILLPLRQLDPSKDQYVYRSLVTPSLEERRSRPPDFGGRPPAESAQHLITALLSNSFRPLSELARHAASYLPRHSESPLLTADSKDVAGSKKTFLASPLMGTWHLITKHGPIGLLEQDRGLTTDLLKHFLDDEAIEIVMEATTRRARGDTQRFNRFLALEAARHLELEVHETVHESTVDSLLRRCDKNLDGSEPLDVLVNNWNQEIERLLRFLIAFYSALPDLLRNPETRVRNRSLASGKPPVALQALWTRFKNNVVGDAGIRDALWRCIGREEVVDAEWIKEGGRLLGAFSGIRNPKVHYDANRKHPAAAVGAAPKDRELLHIVKQFLCLVKRDADPQRPLHPYVLQFKTATFTRGGLTTLKYISDFAGHESSDVVVYTARPVTMAKAYYCLPRLGQSTFRPTESILIDPFLVPAEYFESNSGNTGGA